MRCFFLWALCVLLGSQAIHAQEVPSFTVQDIRVEGLERISDGTVFSYLPIEIGDIATGQRIREGIRALFRTGFFSDIKIARQGNILVVQVEERPAITGIEIDGNRGIKDDDLLRALREIGLSEGETFNRLALDRVEQELTRQYYSQGRYNVSIDSQVEELSRNRVNIDIQIDEGDPAKIKRINIVGNEIFSDDDIIDTFELDTTNWLSWYSRDDQYSREKLSGDLEALRSFYLDRGYVDFEIESTQVSISPDRQKIFITANVREGEPYTVSEINLTGEFPVDAEALESLIVLDEGDTFSRKSLERSVENISGVLANIGYAFANVTPAPRIDQENRQVSLNLFVEPGQRVYVRRINFSGNVNTNDEVLRREMRQFEGGWFSQSAVERSRLRLQRLPYIDEVTIETPQVSGSDDQVDVDIAVRERASGQFQAGFGFSEVQGIIGSLAVSQENFLGTGKRVGLSLSTSRIFRQASLSYVNPYYTDDGVSRGFNISYRELDRGEANVADFLTDTFSVGTVYGIPVTEVDRFRFGLSGELTEVTAFGPADDIIVSDLADTADNFEFILLDPDDPDSIVLGGTGDYTIIRTEFAWIRDSRNRFFNPTRGSTQTFSAEVAVPGSTVEFYRLSYDGRKFFPITDFFTGVLGAELGYGDGYSGTDGLPFFEHFFAGGVRSVRGYEDNTLGPRQVTEIVDPEDPENIIEAVGRPVGGDLKVVGTAELSFPLPFAPDNNNIRLAAFLDVGQVYEDLDAFDAGDFRYTTGLALQWQAPVGPIIINVAFPLNEEEGDETERIQFAFGSFF